MADFITQLTTGGIGAARVADELRSLLNNPMLINTGKESNQMGAFAIPIEVESYRQSMSATVSESVVIAAAGKENLTDNVAPGAWTWDLSGYIPGNPVVEQTNFYTPFVKLNTNLLKNAAKKGFIFKYRDMDNAIYKRVVIQKIDVAFQADCRNRTPVSLTLREINSLEDIMASLTAAEESANPVLGSIGGSALDCGVTLADKLSGDAINSITSNLMSSL